MLILLYEKKLGGSKKSRLVFGKLEKKDLLLFGRGLLLGRGLLRGLLGGSLLGGGLLRGGLLCDRLLGSGGSSGGSSGLLGGHLLLGAGLGLLGGGLLSGSLLLGRLCLFGLLGRHLLGLLGLGGLVQLEPAVGAGSLGLGELLLLNQRLQSLTDEGGQLGDVHLVVGADVLLDRGKGSTVPFLQVLDGSHNHVGGRRVAGLSLGLRGLLSGSSGHLCDFYDTDLPCLEFASIYKKTGDSKSDSDKKKRKKGARAQERNGLKI